MNEQKSKHYLQEELPHGVTGQVEVVTPAQEQLERAQGTLDAIKNAVKGFTKEASEEDILRVVDETVAGYVKDGFENCVGDESCVGGVGMVGVVEVAEPGKQPKTAAELSELLDRDPEKMGEALQIAEEGGVDVGSVVKEIDDAENAKSTSEEGAHKGEILKQYAAFCVWDQELQKPALDREYIEDRKRSTKFVAAEMVKGDWKDCGDEEIIEAIDGCRVDAGNIASDLQQREKDLQERLSNAEYDVQKRKIEAILGKTQKRIQEALQNNGKIDERKATEAVAAILNERLDREAAEAVKEIEKAIEDRVQADKYPWTMPGAELVDPSVMENMKSYYETLIRRHDRKDRVSGGDTIRLGGAMLYDDSKALLREMGGEYNSLKEYKRTDLADRGVFFANTVGEGEQAVFGARLFELSFDPSRKALLTEEQFKEVYNYQQRYGYGIGDLDPDDVVMDMIVADSVRGTRQYNISGIERIDKYGETSSLFVENDGTPLPGSFGGSVMIEGKTYRLSAVQADLINGNKNYPGVSEMYDDVSVAWDQRYMTAGQYIKYMYVPPPTAEDAFYAIKGGGPTAREMKWLGVDTDWSPMVRG